MKFRKDLPENGGSKNFLKLKDKESVTGIFRGEPYEFHIFWENKRSHVVPEEAPDAKFRFRINFVVKDGSSYVPKIFEQGSMVYRQLSELSDEYDLETTVIKITRSGVGTDTTYSLIPLLKNPLTKETVAYLESMQLLDLAHKEEKESDSGLTF